MSVAEVALSYGLVTLASSVFLNSILEADEGRGVRIASSTFSIVFPSMVYYGS